MRLDNFVMGIHDGSILSSNEFNLLSYKGDENIVQTTYTGVYVLWTTGICCGHVLCLLFE